MYNCYVRLSVVSEITKINFTFIDVNWAHLFDRPDTMDFLRWFRRSLITILTRITISSPFKMIGHLFRFTQLFLFQPILFEVAFILMKCWPNAWNHIFLTVAGDIQIYAVNDTKARRIMHHLKALLKHKILKPESDFNWGEFKQSFTVENLCNIIKTKSPSVTINNTVEDLNRLLETETPTLSDILFQEETSHEKISMDDIDDPSIKKLIDITKGYYNKNFSELNSYEKNNIKRLNRLLLEKTFPRETPKTLPEFDDVMIISHSLGTVISHECIAELSEEYEEIREKQKSANYFNIKKLPALFTYGSPLDKFRYLWGTEKPNRFGDQIKVHKDLRWYNIFSYRDFVSAEIDFYSPGPDQFEVSNFHTGYWNNLKCMAYTFYCILDSMRTEKTHYENLKEKYKKFLNNKNLGYELKWQKQIFVRLERWVLEAMPVVGFLCIISKGFLGDWLFILNLVECAIKDFLLNIIPVNLIKINLLRN